MIDKKSSLLEVKSINRRSEEADKFIAASSKVTAYGEGVAVNEEKEERMITIDVPKILRVANFKDLTPDEKSNTAVSFRIPLAYKKLFLYETQIAMATRQETVSMNEFFLEAIEDYVEKKRSEYVKRSAK